MHKQQTGFTLIELAIVLVIIGLLLGGILKAQSLINSAKAKNLMADFKMHRFLFMRIKIGLERCLEMMLALLII